MLRQLSIIEIGSVPKLIAVGANITKCDQSVGAGQHRVLRILNFDDLFVFITIGVQCPINGIIGGNRIGGIYFYHRWCPGRCGSSWRNYDTGQIRGVVGNSVG